MVSALSMQAWRSWGAIFSAPARTSGMFGPRGTGIVWARASEWARIHPPCASITDLELFDAWAEGRPLRGQNTAWRSMAGGFKVLASASPYAPSYARLAAGLMNTPEEVDRALVATRAVAKG